MLFPQCLLRLPGSMTLRSDVMHGSGGVSCTSPWPPKKLKMPVSTAS